jgi:hypothetical protein
MPLIQLQFRLRIRVGQQQYAASGPRMLECGVDVAEARTMPFLPDQQPE